MTKKNWVKPDLMELGLENTKDGNSADERCLFVHKCKHCGQKFSNHVSEVLHEMTCPAKKPVHPLPDGDLEDWVVSPS